MRVCRPPATVELPPKLLLLVILHPSLSGFKSSLCTSVPFVFLSLPSGFWVFFCFPASPWWMTARIGKSFGLYCIFRVKFPFFLFLIFSLSLLIHLRPTLYGDDFRRVTAKLGGIWRHWAQVDQIFPFLFPFIRFRVSLRKGRTGVVKFVDFL